MNRQLTFKMPFKRIGKAFSRLREKLLSGKRLLVIFIPFLFIFCLISSCSLNPQSSSEEPVEPLVTGKETLRGEPLLRGRFSILNPEMEIFALSVSSNGKDILFSSEARTISKLDDEGNLRWEITSEGLPVCASLTEDGRFAAVGTDEGTVYFLREDGHILWQTSFQSRIEHIVLNKNGDTLVLSVPGEKDNILYCLDRWGTILWEMETGLLQELYFTAGEEIYYLEKEKSGGSLKAVREGELIWEKDALLAAFSAEGDYFGLYNGVELQYYRLEMDGYPSQLCSFSPRGEKEISWLGLTERGQYLLAYNALAVGKNNLWVFNRDGLLLWERRIPSGALLSFSSSGERIVASSWQEYSEDFSKVIVLNNYGDILQEVEMGSRIEKNVLSNDGGILVLAGSDGNLFILEIPVDGAVTQKNHFEGEEQAKTIYRPLTFGKPERESYLKLFFFDEDANNLIPINRLVKAAPHLFQTAVDELVKGPRRSSGLSRTISKDVHIEAIVQEDIVYVDLPAELDKLGGTTQVAGLIDSLVLTLSQFSSVQGIQFLLEGEKVSVFTGEGFMIDKVFSPLRLGEKPALYLPCRSGDRYYLLPREAGKSMEPVDLANEVLRHSYPFLSVKPELKEMRIEGKEIVLDWEASFTEIFPPEGSSEEKALAQLFTDALLLTLTENLLPDRLVFLVEGELWAPPEDYTLSMELQRPFFINPE